MKKSGLTFKQYYIALGYRCTTKVALNREKRKLPPYKFPAIEAAKAHLEAGFNKRRTK